MSVHLTADQRSLLDAARRATLATIGTAGQPRLVPCCFALGEDPSIPVVYTPIDDKPKRSAEPRTLARVQDIERDPRVSVLVDRWDEDWTRLAWLRLDGIARLVWPSDVVDEHADAVRALRARYPQYATHALELLPIIRVAVTGMRGWVASDG